MSRSASFTARLFCASIIANHGEDSRAVQFQQINGDGDAMTDVSSEIFTFTPEEAAAFDVGKVYDVTFTPAPVA